MDEVMTIQEASQFLKVSVPMIYRLMREAELHPIRRGKRYTRLLKSDLIAFLGRHQVGGEHAGPPDAPTRAGVKDANPAKEKKEESNG